MHPIDHRRAPPPLQIQSPPPHSPVRPSPRPSLRTRTRRPPSGDTQAPRQHHQFSAPTPASASASSKGEGQGGGACGTRSARTSHVARRTSPHTCTFPGNATQRNTSPASAPHGARADGGQEGRREGEASRGVKTPGSREGNEGNAEATRETSPGKTTRRYSRCRQETGLAREGWRAEGVGMYGRELPFVPPDACQTRARRGPTPRLRAAPTPRFPSQHGQGQHSSPFSSRESATSVRDRD